MEAGSDSQEFVQFFPDCLLLNPTTCCSISAITEIGTIDGQCKGRSIDAKSMQLTFRPSNNGTNQILRELDSKVMAIVWKQSGCSAKEVLETLEPPGMHAYTTVATILHRLCQKGLLTRVRQGKAFLYQPTISREEFTERVTRDVLAGLLKEEGRPIVSTFVDLLSEEKELLEELRILLEQKGS